MRFILAYLESKEAVKTCIQIQGWGNLGSYPAATSTELSDLGHVNVLFQFLFLRFLCHTDEH